MLLPPAPVGTPFGTYAWADWYQKLRYIINSSAVDHQGLENLQGGNTTERYHLTNAEHTALVALANTDIDSGSYTPTYGVATGGNMTSVTPGVAIWQRVGDIVHVAGTVTIQASSSPANMKFYLTYPNSWVTPNTSDQTSGTFAGQTSTQAGSVSMLASELGAALFQGESVADVAAGTEIMSYHYMFIKL